MNAPFLSFVRSELLEFLPALYKNAAAMAVDGGENREVFNGKALNGFTAQIMERDLRRLLDAAGDQRARAAHGAEIGALVAHDGVDHGLTALALADHGGQTKIQ